MPKNKIDPKLKIILKEGENIKKKSNKLIKDGNSKLVKFEKKKLSEKDVKTLHDRCETEIKNVKNFIEKLSDIEPVMINMIDDTINKELFEDLVQAEAKRQQLSLDEILKIANTLYPEEDESETDSELTDEITETATNYEDGDEDETEVTKTIASENTKTGDEDTDFSQEDNTESEGVDGQDLMKTSKTPLTLNEKALKNIPTLMSQKKQTLTKKATSESVQKKKLKPKSKPEQPKQSEPLISSEDEEESAEVSDDELSAEEEENQFDDEITVDHTMTGQYMAIGDFQGQVKGDLAFKSGDLFTILSARSDGWLNAVKVDDGTEGLVPKNYLEKCEDEEDATESVVRGHDNQLDDELSDDDSSYIEETESESEMPAPKSQKRAKDLWANIKKGVKEANVKDILNALGSLPMGFCTSTLGPLQQKDANRLKGYLVPQLNASNLGYKDLFLDSTTNKIKSLSVSTQRVVTVTQIRQMPVIGDAFSVVDRFIRVCLFDGHMMLSNIITIKVSGIDKDQRTWNFNNKIFDTMKSLEYSEFFIRTNSMNTKLGILVEVSLTFTRKSNEKISEISCGWVNLPLYDSDPKPVANKTYDVMLNGGTCFDHGQLIDPNLSKKNEGSILRNIMSSNKQPHISIRLTLPTKQQKILLDTLPETLVASSCYMQYMSLYREILTDSLVRDRLDLYSTGLFTRCLADLVYGPVISNFPVVCDQTDLMDVLRISWADYQNKNKRTISSLMTKRDPEYLKEQFRTVFMKNVYPLLQVKSVLPFNAHDNQILQSREVDFKHMKVMDKNSPVYILTSGSLQHRPFDINELCFNPIGPHCIGAIR